MASNPYVNDLRALSITLPAAGECRSSHWVQMNSRHFKIPDHVTWKSLKEGIVLLNLESGDYYTLNETASLLWTDISKGSSGNGLVDSFVDEFFCSHEQAEADIDEAVSYLISEKLLEVVV